MAELAYLGRLAGYRPYFIGFSQFEEMKKGLDVYYSAGALIGFFQFKRGYPWAKFFSFYINNNPPHYNQHHALCKINSPPGACRYVFPMIATNEDVYLHRGFLLFWTAFMPPQLFNVLTPSNTYHIVRMYYDGTWERKSEIKRGEWTNVFGMSTEEMMSLGKEMEQQPFEYQRNWAENAFRNLELPNIVTTLERLELEDTADIFKQRSSFCMIFDE
ncbi:MAG: hypothetical protein HQ577_00095 [Dehalococcoidia bacterium]|nr:hypothetical protein [Dehalococcoidia bacterium]